MSILFSQCAFNARKAVSDYTKPLSKALHINVLHIGLGTELCTFKGTDRIALVLQSTDSH